MSRWLWRLVLVLAGGAQALSLAWPFAVGPTGEPVPALQWLSLLVLLAGLRAAPAARAAFMQGWWFATAWLVATFWWLFISMHTYGGLAAPLAAVAVLALAAALGVYYAVASAVYWRWRHATPAAQAVAFAALWTLAELARGTLFTGFPWGAGGYAHIDTLGALAPYLGVYGMGAVSAALAAGLLAAFSQGNLLGLGWRWRVFAMVAVPLVCWPLPGRWLVEHLPAHTRSHGELTVTLLQGNVPQDEKFTPGAGIPLALEWYGGQLRQAVARADAPHLVVAPETAIPVLPQELDPAYLRSLLNAVAAGKSAVMLGLPVGNWTDGFTNTTLSWGPGLQQHRYDKHHLVPFGEFIPTGFRWFTQLMHIPLGDFARGALAQPPLVWAGQRIAPNICYEDLFGEELAASFRDPAQAPTVLVNVSNIAWFGDTVAIDQHRNISRLRALELQRPMVRATNTGATVAIDHLGRVTHELPRLTRGTLDATVQGRDGATPFARWAGRWGLWPLVLVAVLALAWAARRTRIAAR